MIRINLLPKEERIAPRRISMPKFGALAPVGVVAAALLVVVGAAVFERARLATLHSDVTDLREEVRAIQPQVDRVKRLTAQREELERRLDIIRDLDDGRFLSVRIMDNVSRETPRYMWFTDVEQQGSSRVLIRGRTFSNLIVSDLMIRLERSPLFANIDLARTSRGRIEDRDIMEFSISADLTPDEAPSDFTAQAVLDPITEEGN